MAFNLREIFKALAQAEVDYVVVGGLAVIMHGHLRATRDLDLVIGLQPNNCAKGMDALSSIGLRPRLPVSLADFADPEKREDWLLNRNMLVFQLWDPANPERSVDIFVREPLDFGTMMAEAVVKDLDGVPIPVASIRHLITLKQMAGRPLDMDDIEALRQIAAETGQELP
ncbi:MAG: nucleotidyltransferase [Lysobacter sp.]|nr:nucleotidyltransferase [Lysobacter sp.]